MSIPSHLLQLPHTSLAAVAGTHVPPRGIWRHRRAPPTPTISDIYVYMLYAHI